MLRVAILLTIGLGLTLVTSAFSTSASASRVIIEDIPIDTDTLTIEIKRPDLRCDGVDSSLIVLTRQREDGRPAAGEKQPILMYPGSYSVINAVPEPGGDGNTYRYDSSGQLRLHVTPASSPWGFWQLHLPSRLGDRSGIRHFSCPFTDNNTYTISGAVWNDRDANGGRDSGERDVSGFGIKIECVCAYFDTVPWHYQRTDHSGNYEWIGLHKGGFSESAPWEMCIDDQYARRWAIVSVNGSRVPATACIPTPIAVPGDQFFSLGVAEY